RRRLLSHRAAARLLRRKARHDGRPAQRPRQTRNRRDRRPSHPPARADRSQAPARLHHPADPGDRRRARLRRPIPLRPLLPQIDRHHAARVSRPARRLIGRSAAGARYWTGAAFAACGTAAAMTFAVAAIVCGAAWQIVLFWTLGLFVAVTSIANNAAVAGPGGA